MGESNSAGQTVLGGAKVWPKGGNPNHDPKTGRFTTGSVQADQPILTITAPRGSSKPGQNWTAKNHTVKVPDRIRANVDNVVKAFNKATGKDLVVTEGMRTPMDQAKRMYYKYSHGDFKTYKGHLGHLIANIYRDGVKNKDSPD